MQTRVTKRPYMSAFEHALVESTHKKLKEGPEAGRGMVELIEDSKRPGWSGYLMQSFFGLHSLRDVYEAYAFTLAMTKLYSGQIAMCAIRSKSLGGGPASDSSVKENNRRLSSLPAPFSAVFNPTRGRGYNDDGQLSWSAEITLETWISDNNDPQSDPIRKLRTAEPCSVPFEVGSCSAARVLEHVFTRSGNIARWPYGSDKILLVVRTPAWNEECEAVDAALEV